MMFFSKMHNVLNQYRVGTCIVLIRFNIKHVLTSVRFFFFFFFFFFFCVFFVFSKMHNVLNQ